MDDDKTLLSRACMLESVATSKMSTKNNNIPQKGAHEQFRISVHSQFYDVTTAHC